MRGVWPRRAGIYEIGRYPEPEPENETMKDRCEHENSAGHRCAFGPGHTCPCLFKPLKLTDAQTAILQEVSRVPVRKFQCIGTSTTATLKALLKRGFIGLRYINSRAWDAWLTPAGKRILIDLPR
jgi:hypothetical protein